MFSCNCIPYFLTILL
ncbi:unnamed protein product [Nezara viridula]|uniref:Uncharacterized protein n=1 Tax=Nezara viridula TaxID=85310 RepID=A0A9P0HJT7_NEZVI|nr:unnamed protein product [Nezara viridula]